MAVAIDQHHGFKPFVPSQRCKLQSFTHLNRSTMLQFSPTTNLTYNSLKQAIKDVNNIHRSFSTPCLSLSSTYKVDKEFDASTQRIEIVCGRGVPRVRALVAEVSISMASGINPKPVSSGLGGAYFLCSYNGNNIAVAKPIDEEPMACNNPKGFAGQMLGQPGLKRSIRVGETAIRELAAYLLDHGEFAGVPATALVKFSYSTSIAFHHVVSNTGVGDKIASLQRFVEHDFDAGELGPSGFSVGSVHRIGILDVRLLNLDRHAGNILVKKKKKKKFIDDDVGVAEELVPIDHGLCLPEWLDDPYFEWLHWPQASVPFTESEAEYISNLDPFKDAKLLRAEVPFLRESSIRVLVLCTIFLKRAVAAGMCLADIGGMMTREFCGGRAEEEDSSVLENVCEKAKARMRGGIIFSADHDDHVQSEGTTTTTSQAAEEIGMFQFDDEFHDGSKFVALGLTRLVPKIPRFSSSASSSSDNDDAVLFDAILHEELDDADFEGYEEEDDDKCKLRGGGVLTRSISFSVQKKHNESKGIICFDEMSENEWQSFLEDFEKLLPEVFEDTKSLSLKQRLGTSCKF